MMRKEFDPETFRKIGVSWKDASTPTRAASADEATKLVGADVLPPTSSVTWDRIGLSAQEQQQLRDEQGQATVRSLVEGLRAKSGETRSDPNVIELADRTVADRG
jgi:hypothetical protein